MNPSGRTGPGNGRAISPLEQALVDLSGSLTNLGQDVRGLRDDVQQAEARRRRGNKLIAAGLIVVLLAVTMLSVVTVQNRQVLDSTSQTNATMADCTTPGGKCYEESRRRTGEAINNILLVSIYMAQCARLYPNEAGPDYDRKLEVCIYERLGMSAAPTSPTPTPAPTGGG